jgi:hypothetical protein
MLAMLRKYLKKKRKTEMTEMFFPSSSPAARRWKKKGRIKEM